ATPVPATPQAEEIAPEDLPPLEYSELQKANSRRRRRHRAGPNNGSSAAPSVAKPAPPEASTPATSPVPTPTGGTSPAPVMPTILLHRHRYISWGACSRKPFKPKRIAWSPSYDEQIRHRPTYQSPCHPSPQLSV